MQHCPYCSNNGIKISHSGICPKVKAIEYYQNGSQKRVEFFSPGDYMQPFGVGTWPPPEEFLPSYTDDTSGIVYKPNTTTPDYYISSLISE